MYPFRTPCMKSNGTGSYVTVMAFGDVSLKHVAFPGATDGAVKKGRKLSLKNSNGVMKNF